MKETLRPIHVKILSFQSIEEIEFDIYGFTCITGITNIGKSAIIRAISGALTNAPVGPLVRKGARYCSVSINTAEWGFTWEKGERGINRYHIRGRDTPLDKVGIGQVDEIANLGFNSVRIGSSSIYPWWAPQFEPLFLVNQSGPAITDFISEVSRLQVLQNAISINIKNRKHALDEVKVRSENLQKLQTKEQSLAKCDTALQIKNELEAQAASIKEYEARISAAESLANTIAQTEARIAKTENIESVIVPEAIPAEECGYITNMYAHWLALEQAARHIIALREITTITIPELPPNLPSVEDITIAERIAIRIDELNRSIQILSGDIHIPKLKEAFPELSKMEGILTRLEAAEAEKNTLSGQLGATVEELSKVEAEIAKIPLCPVCLRPTQTHIHA